MGYYVYILYSAQLDLYYIGSSADPQNRLKKHLANHKGFTSKTKDWIICYTKKYDSKSKALNKRKAVERLEKSDPDSAISI